MPTQTSRINLTKPDTGNKTWESDVENWADKLDEVAAQYIPFHYSGEAIANEIIFDGFNFDEAVTITGVDLYAREAPTGAALTVDFTKDAIEQANVATLVAGSKKQSTVIAGLSFAAAEEFGLKIKSVGSLVPGAEIVVIVHYHIKATV